MPEFPALEKDEWVVQNYDALLAALAPDGILSGLKEVHIVATMNLDPVIIKINLKQKAFLSEGPDAA
ncbi:hypothetical protein KJ359_007494, partial [Pestalotiopsis sp. 9143b]